jgi:hypothetical protein
MAQIGRKPFCKNCDRKLSINCDYETYTCGAAYIAAENSGKTDEVDRHWQEKNTSVKEDGIYIRLYNKMRGFQDCKVELNSDKIQKIP